MKFHLQLALYDENGDVLALEEYLSHLQQGLLAKANTEDATIIFEWDEHEWIANTWNFGCLHYLISQFEAAYQRLSRGDMALIRSGIMENDVPYLLIELASDNTISLSLFLMDNPSLAFTFPIEGISGYSADLYDYVASHRTKLLKAAAAMGDEHFVALHCPHAALLDSLKREVDLGRHLLSRKS